MEMPIKELKYWLTQASDICSKRNETGSDPEYYCCLDGSPYEWDVDFIGG